MLSTPLRSKQQRKSQQTRLLLIAMLLGTLTLAGCVSTAFNQDLSLTHYQISSASIPTGQQLRLVQISDLHQTLYGANQSELLALIRSQEPDLILLTGDIIDEESAFDNSVLLLSQLAAIAPSYYAMGNHEYWTYQIPAIQALLQQHRITLLQDSYVTLAMPGYTLIVAGADDPDRTRYYDASYNHLAATHNAFDGLRGLNGLQILLAHRPERIDHYLGFSFNLILSGHAHGGQVRIPGLAAQGLYAPNQGLFPRYTGGIFVHKTGTHVVSRGLAIHPSRPRIYNRPELVVITLVGEG